MTITHRVEMWADVSPLPNIEYEQGDLYLRFPSRTTTERARDGLRQAGFQVKASGELVLCVPEADPAPVRLANCRGSDSLYGAETFQVRHGCEVRRQPRCTKSQAPRKALAKQRN